jgi:two-component system invasion response regulator UvrY
MGILIGLVDDHTIMRNGLKSLIEMTGKFKVILEASDGPELLEKLENKLPIPEILILDISLPKMDGYTVIEKLTSQYPHLKILVFSLFSAEDAILNAINRGACGYVSKTADPDQLLHALTGVAKSGYYFSNFSKKQKIIGLEHQKKPKAFHGKQVLSEKEIQFIRLAATNMTYKEIAVKMNVQPKTVENYRDSLFQKLGLNNRAALTYYGIQNGIIVLF